jgi:hypothetical protein
MDILGRDARSLPMPRKKTTNGEKTRRSKKVVTREEIETLAYYKWLERGCPQDDPGIDWLAAEKELNSK